MESVNKIAVNTNITKGCRITWMILLVVIGGGEVTLCDMVDGEQCDMVEKVVVV